MQKQGAQANTLINLSGFLLYPLAISVSYLLISNFKFVQPSHLLWSFFVAILFGFIVPSVFLLGAFYGQMWLWSRNLGELPLRKVLASILGSVAILIAHQTVESGELSSIHFLLALDVTLLAIVIGMHPNLRGYLGVSGGLSEYG